MGVLEPLERNSEEIQRVTNEYSEVVDMAIEGIQNYAAPILNNRIELLEENAPDFLALWTEQEFEDLQTEEDLSEELEMIQNFKQNLKLGSVEARYAKSFVEKNDVEVNYDNPINSYAELDTLQEELDGLVDRIRQTMVDKFNIDQDRFYDELTKEQYEFRKSFFDTTDSFDAFFIREAIHEIDEEIDKEKENLLSKAVDEHREGRQEFNEEYDELTDFPSQPVDWEEKIGEETLSDFYDLSEMVPGFHGHTLHKLMEEICKDVERVQSEYPLHFLNEGERDDTPVFDEDGNVKRIDNTVRPDAVDDMFVYEFKHLPDRKIKYLEENREIKRDGKFLDNVDQLNGYLSDLDQPVGILVYITSDMEVQEYVVESHNERLRDPEAIEDYIHEKEEYDFSQVSSKF